jgi:hypothetical protein
VNNFRARVFIKIVLLVKDIYGDSIGSNGHNNSSGQSAA